MFLNNPAPTRSILNNNENSTAGLRAKSIGGENGGGGLKKTTFNENSVAKTPHRNKDATKGGQTTQRRRRALGDISNRKGGGGGATGGKGGVVLKQQSNNTTTQSALKLGNSKVLFPSSSTKSRTSQVKFSKTPSTKSNTSNKARLGGGSGVKSTTSSKPKAKQSNSLDEYDGVYGITTRWADDVNHGDETRPPYGLVPEEELFMAENIRDEMQERRQKEKEERDRLEDERHEALLDASVQAFHEQNDRDIAEMGTIQDILGEDDNNGWDLLDKKLPWEEEDGSTFDPTEERRLSGADPFSLWGDIDDI